MAAASHNSHPPTSKPTASTTTAAASNSSKAQSRDNKTQTVPSSPPLSPSPVTSLPTSSADGSATLSSSNSQRQQPPNGVSPTTTTLTGPPKNGSLFAFAAAALSGISEPRLRPRQSLTRLSIGLDSGLGSGRPSPDKPSRHRSTLSSSFSSSSLQGEGKKSPGANPPSRPYSETDPNRPLPIHIPHQASKMHQTSSRLLRMTDDDKPFTRVRISPKIVGQEPAIGHAVTRYRNWSCIAAG